MKSINLEVEVLAQRIADEDGQWRRGNRTHEEHDANSEKQSEETLLFLEITC